MKELKDYVCTKEQGKKLRELGIKDKSLFNWIENKSSSFVSTPLNDNTGKDSIPAFTSQELIEIIANINDYALESYFDDVVYIKGENEAEQRAQFLIDYLKMIKKEEEQQNESNN